MSLWNISPDIVLPSQTCHCFPMTFRIRTKALIDLWSLKEVSTKHLIYHVMHTQHTHTLPFTRTPCVLLCVILCMSSSSNWPLVMQGQSCPILPSTCWVLHLRFLPSISITIDPAGASEPTGETLRDCIPSSSPEHIFPLWDSNMFVSVHNHTVPQ